jgi:hypothetical protein
MMGDDCINRVDRSKRCKEEWVSLRNLTDIYLPFTHTFSRLFRTPDFRIFGKNSQ